VGLSYNSLGGTGSLTGRIQPRRQYDSNVVICEMWGRRFKARTFSGLTTVLFGRIFDSDDDLFVLCQMGDARGSSLESGGVMLLGVCQGSVAMHVGLSARYRIM